MKHIVIIRSIFGEILEVFGPFESITQADAWIDAEIDTEACLTSVFGVRSPILEKV